MVAGEAGGKGGGEGLTSGLIAAAKVRHHRRGQVRGAVVIAEPFLDGAVLPREKRLDPADTSTVRPRSGFFVSKKAALNWSLIAPAGTAGSAIRAAIRSQSSVLSDGLVWSLCTSQSSASPRPVRSPITCRTARCGARIRSF